MIDVAFTRAEARRAEVIVVIDVLRATSTIVQALAAGYRRVVCADTLDRARALAAPGRVLAGERGCVAPDDFDLGNSPTATDPPLGDELVLATTNGAPAIVRAAELSPRVLIACLLNLDAVVAALAGERNVQLLCSGTDGRPALEDTYVAGRLSARLPGRRSDGARIAEAVAAHGSGRDALEASADAQVLRARGLGSDIEWSTRDSVIPLVPRATRLGEGLAAVDWISNHPMDHEEHLASFL